MLTEVRDEVLQISGTWHYYEYTFSLVLLVILMGLYLERRHLPYIGTAIHKFPFLHQSSTVTVPVQNAKGTNWRVGLSTMKQLDTPQVVQTPQPDAVVKPQLPVVIIHPEHKDQ